MSSLLQTLQTPDGRVQYWMQEYVHAMAVCRHIHIIQPNYIICLSQIIWAQTNIKLNKNHTHLDWPWTVKSCCCWIYMKYIKCPTRLLSSSFNLLSIYMTNLQSLVHLWVIRSDSVFFRYRGIIREREKILEPVRTQLLEFLKIQQKHTHTHTSNVKHLEDHRRCESGLSGPNVLNV